MDCENARELLEKKTLTPSQQQELLAHLDTCQTFRNMLELLHLTDDAVASLEEEPPEQLVEKTMWQIAPELMEKRTGTKKRRRFPFAGTAIAAVAAAALLVIGYTQLNGPAGKTEDAPADAVRTSYGAATMSATEAQGGDSKSVEGITQERYSLAPTGAEVTAAPADTESGSIYGINDRAPASGYLRAEDTASCTAVLTLDSGDSAPEGRPEGSWQVQDVEAWLDGVFGSDVAAAYSADGDKGTHAVTVFALSSLELEALQAQYPGSLCVVRQDEGWTVCTLVVVQ